MKRRHALPLAGLTRRPHYHWYVVGTVCIGAFMAALDGSIVTVAQPSITRLFHTSPSATEWVALAYLLTLTALLAMFGRLADIVGRRPLYTLGFSVFIVGSALCGAAPNLPALIAFRVLQSVGAVMLQANSVAIVTAAAPESVRGRAIGIQGAALAVGLSLGPAIGGLLIGAFGWRSIFYVNVPVGIIGTTLAALILPVDRFKDAGAKGHRFDYFGALVMAVALVALVLGLNQGNSQGWSSPFILGCFAVGLASIAVFIRIEKRHPAPLVDLSLFRIPPWLWGNITGALSYAVMYGILYTVPYFYEDGLHKPASLSGLLTTPLPIGMMLLAPVAGRIYDKLGPRLPTVVGMAVTTVGTGALMLLDAHVSYALLVVSLLFIGVGMGIFTPPNNSSVMSASPRNRLGVTSGILNMSRSLGQSVGIAFAFTVLEGVLQTFGYSRFRLASMPALLASFRWTFFAVALLGAAAILISILRGHGPRAELAPEDRIIDV